MPPKKRDKENDSGKSNKVENSTADQEQFLQAFEKPTQIYRFLRTRNMIKPLFLFRNLTYMKHRMSRSNKNRKHFKIDSILQDVTGRLSKQPLNTYLTLTFLGFYSRRAFRVGHEGPVKVETLLMKICHKRRKESVCPVISISLGTATVDINPCEISPPAKAPTVCIPTEKFMLPTGGTVKTYKLILKVTTSKAVEDFVPTLKDDSDNVIKKSKTGTGDEDEPAIFTTSMVLFNKQNQCLLTEGDYEFFLERCDESTLKANPLSTWEDCRGLLDQEDRHRDSFQKMLDGPTLKFRVSFEREQVSTVVDWPKPITPRDHMVAEKIPEPVDRRYNELKVVYQFLYNSNSRQQTEASNDMRCPWCTLDCKALYSLLKHLKLCHPRFNFNYVPVQGGVRIDISVNETYDGSSWTTVGCILSRGSGPIKRQPISSIIVCRPKRTTQNLSEFINTEDTEAPRPYITGHNRLYHHTTTCLPIYPKEMDIDSEDETDPRWLQKKTIMMIDEFTDVNEGEKELMKMWNLHVMKHGFVGDVQVQLACEMFLQEKGKELLIKNLYRNFVLHMCNLFDFGLVSPLTVFKIMQQVQEIIQSDDKVNKLLQDCWTAQREQWNPLEQAPKHDSQGTSSSQGQDSGTSRRKPTDEKGKRRRGRRLATSSKPELRSKDSSNKKSAVPS